MVLCRSVMQTSHSMLPLPTQHWWVPGGREFWTCGSSCLHTVWRQAVRCVHCIFPGMMSNVCVSCIRKGNWSFEYGMNIRPWTLILIYQGVHCCTKVCNLHLDDSPSKSRDNRMHWTRSNLLKWKGIYKNYEPFTDQLQPIYFTCNDL